MPAGVNEITIDKYVLYHNAKADPGKIRIWLWSADSQVGTIDFYEGRIPVSKMFLHGDKLCFSLNYEIDRYQEIIGTLRYETPIAINITWDANNTITNGNICTGLEPVGEQEGV